MVKGKRVWVKELRQQIIFLRKEVRDLARKAAQEGDKEKLQQALAKIKEAKKVVVEAFAEKQYREKVRELRQARQKIKKGREWPCVPSPSIWTR
ncbi:MAG: hypothetical protein PWQ91_271 [Eubacteriales bacterium]|nr:hypothetical protein [Eubacteriales bacterium]